jgi:hypothetical protein
MRAGRLKTKRYPVRKRGGWAAALLLAGLLLGAGAVTYGKQAWEAALPLLPGVLQSSAAQTPAPETAVREERTLTLPGHTWYALQLGTFDSADAAEALAETYRNRGAAGYIRRQGQYQVLAAAYTARADAQAVMTQLRVNHQVEAKLTEITQPEVTLRLSGRPAIMPPYPTLTTRWNSFPRSLRPYPTAWIGEKRIGRRPFPPFAPTGIR